MTTAEVMMKNGAFLLLLLPVYFVAGLLSGCASGGGFVDVGPFTPVEFHKGGDLRLFQRWSAIDPPGYVDIRGVFSEERHTTPGPAHDVTDTNTVGVNYGSVATVSFRQDGSVHAISVYTPHTEFVWIEGRGDIIEDDGALIEAVDAAGEVWGWVSNPMHPDNDWEYQSYGTWLSGRGRERIRAGAGAFGRRGGTGSVPTTGSATFTGGTVGQYVDGGGRLHVTNGRVTVEADFVDRSLDFTSTGTQIGVLAGGTMTPAPQLDMSGVLRFEEGRDAFGGTLMAPGLTGTSSGRFFGPNAEELGGVFTLTGSGLEHYSGAYGAKR
jgi:hypothetical protein